MRRTLSPVPRPSGAGESTSTSLALAVTVASPLSKCSSSHHHPAATDPSSFAASPSTHHHYAFYPFLLNLFPSGSSERQKPKPSAWRRSFFHFLLSFLVGVFLGFTPFVSITASTDVVSKSQAFSFDQVQLYDVSHSHVMSANMLNDSEPHMTGVKRENVTMERGFVKFLILVTTTPTRGYYYLNRLARTLRMVEPPLLWVVVEMTRQSKETSELLRRSGVMYRHLVCTENNMTEVKDLRVHQRNVALSHIETHRLDGIVYFADDTNVYSTQLFHHMRQIRRFGTWQVAKLKKSTRVANFVGPICNGTQVTGWHANNVMRRYHADLSGFAFNSTILWDPKHWHRPSTQPIRHLDTVMDG